MGQRIDISYRVISGVNDQVSVDYNGLGARICTIDPALYMSARALASALQNAIDAQWSASASFECNANTDGTFSIDSTSAAFDLVWGKQSLRDWLGFSGNLSGSSLYTGDAMPGVLVESLPWVNDRHGWVWAVNGIDHKFSGQAVAVSRRDLWSVDLYEYRENLPQLRSVFEYLMRGVPATWYRSDLVSAFSYSNWFGAVQFCVDPRRSSYSEAFQSPNNLQSVFVATLEMVQI